MTRVPTVTLPLPEGHTAMLVVLTGHVTVNARQEAGEAEVLLLGREGGGVSIHADGDAMLLVLTGEPIDEPIVGHGPFVMNREAEIRQADRRFQQRPLRNGNLIERPTSTWAGRLVQGRDGEHAAPSHDRDNRCHAEKTGVSMKDKAMSSEPMRDSKADRLLTPQNGHYIDIDRYGKYPFDALPRKWNDALEKFSGDTLQAHGIVPWWVQTMLYRLTDAFKEKDQAKILKLSAEIGHYIADAHVPLHANSNHNGQYTNQQGIHGFWESRVPELLADKEWDFFIGKADYIKDPGNFIWQRVLESAAAADTVLRYEKELSEQFPADQKFSFEDRNGVLTRQYSSAYTKAYDIKLRGMVERRMRMAIYSVASFGIQPG